MILRCRDTTDSNRIFLQETFPGKVGDMGNLRWLRLDSSNLETLPDTLGNLSKLVRKLLIRFASFDGK